MDLKNLRVQISFYETSDLDFDPFWEVYDIETGEGISVTPEVQTAAFHMMRLCAIRIQQDKEFQLSMNAIKNSIAKI